jgi:hypothetical protein
MRLEAEQIANQVPSLKTLYICQCVGCGWISERKSKYCVDHAKASQRAECRIEFTAISQTESHRLRQQSHRPAHQQAKSN